MNLEPHNGKGLIFYFGPVTYNPTLKVQDFMSLELQDGYLVLYVNYGTGTSVLKQKKKFKLTDGKSHRIDIEWSRNVSCY